MSAESINIQGPSYGEMNQAVDEALNVTKDTENYLKRPTTGDYTDETIVAGEAFDPQNSTGEIVNSSVRLVGKEGHDRNFGIHASAKKIKPAAGFKGSMSVETHMKPGSESFTEFTKVKPLPNGEVKILRRSSERLDVGRAAVKYAAEKVVDANQNNELPKAA